MDRNFEGCGMDSIEFITHSTECRQPEAAASIAWGRTATPVLAPDYRLLLRQLYSYKAYCLIVRNGDKKSMY